MSKSKVPAGGFHFEASFPGLWMSPHCPPWALPLDVSAHVHLETDSTKRQGAGCNR